MNEKAEGIGLKALIRSVHEELIESQSDRERNGMSPLFAVEALELELHFMIGETERDGGKFDLKILSLSSNHTVDSEQVHKITLRLRALEPEPYPRPTALDTDLRPGMLPKKVTS